MSEELSELFYKDEYMKEFDAKVVSCVPSGKGFVVVLSDTAFYPEGGGQPADHGTLGDAKVTDVRRKDGAVLHFTDKALPVGETVHGVIDWQRRFDFMQNHSGEHIVSGLVHRKYGYDNVGFHMSDKVTIDFNGPLTWEEVLAIEKEANEVLWKNAHTVVTYPTKEELPHIDYRSKKELTGTVRLVEFPDADLCACCGTHVEQAGEVGVIKMISLMNHRDGVRLELLCGRWAMDYLDKVLDLNTEIAQSFSVKPFKTAAAVEKAKAESVELSHKLLAANRRYFQMKAETLPDTPVVIDWEEDMQPGDLRKGCDILLEVGHADVYVLLSAGAGDTVYYVIGSQKQDVRPAGKALNAVLHGRGGGSKEAVQGSWKAEKTAVEEAVRNYFAKETV